MNVRTVTIAVGLMLLGGSADAQENPNNFHSRHNGDSVYNVDRPQRPPTESPPRPTGYWEKTWGAIATSDTGGALGTATGLSSKEQAERVAMQDCKTKGGGGCRVGLSYQNQCAVMAVGDGIALTRAASIEEAKADALKTCESKQDNCRVYYSACTEPKFHPY